MTIIYKSNGLMEREIIKKYLKKKIQANPDYKVIDVGGVANTWCDEYVSAYVDINPHPSKKVFVGDINQEGVWSEIEKEKWDFCICTHTLEDIRNPGFVIEKIKSISGAGFISMPNKHTELSNVSSKRYVGYPHHRWIFQITEGDTIRAVAKFPFANHYGTQSICLKFVEHIRYFLRHYVRRKPINKLHKVRWLNKELASSKCELAFIWENDFLFEYINNDYPGSSVYELSKLYAYDLCEGL